MTMTETTTDEPTGTSDVRIERDGAIATVFIDRPKALNALSPAVLRSLAEAFESLAAEGAAVRGVLLVGAGGRAFVAGADIRELARFTPEEGAATAMLGHRLAAIIEALPAPVIACVDGFALGGGLELALACDFIYATDGSGFGQPEVKLGLIPGFGGTVRLPRAVGLAARRSCHLHRAAHRHRRGRRDRRLVVRRFADRESLLARGCPRDPRPRSRRMRRRPWASRSACWSPRSGTPTATAGGLEVAGSATRSAPKTCARAWPRSSRSASPTSGGR